MAYKREEREEGVCLIAGEEGARERGDNRMERGPTKGLGSEKRMRREAMVGGEVRGSGR